MANVPMLDLRHQIFCNVELNGGSIEAVGFDMDFTLAQYNEAFDLLAFEGAKAKLLTLGYPEEVLKFEYSPEAFRRGLIIDKKRGNILKVDRHKYVRKAFHGLTEMSSADRKNTYGQQVASFTESNYVNIDTLFLLVDAILFANLVDFCDKNPLKMNKSYEQIYADVRRCVDICHRDGVIKDTVRNNPSKYIIYDEGIVPMLQRLKSAGKKVFLLTNSMWEYTTVVMDYLVRGKGEYSDIEWQDLFDVIIVGACKPGFLTDTYLNLFRVSKDGSLLNIEDKDSLGKATLGSGGKVFQGGHWVDLHRLIEVKSGDRVLYVGDHMYADILRSKRSLGWRTCLIIPELENELIVAKRESGLREKILKMRQLQYDLDEYIDILRQKERMGINVADSLKEAELKAVELKRDLRDVTDEYNGKFNARWGQLFKAGHQDSRFAKQVADYSCLYTSRASNLGKVSPNRPFRPLRDFMPHDLLVQSDNQ